MDTNLIELVWTTLAFIGAWYAFFGLVDARADMTALKELGINGRRILIAKANQRHEVSRLVIMIIFIIIGLIAILSPDRDETTIQGYIFAGFLITVAALSTWGSILDKKTRAQFVELSKRAEKAGIEDD